MDSSRSRFSLPLPSGGYPELILVAVAGFPSTEGKLDPSAFESKDQKAHKWYKDHVPALLGKSQDWTTPRLPSAVETYLHNQDILLGNLKV